MSRVLCRPVSTVPVAPGQWVDKWLSGPRFEIYVDAVGGDRADALELYEWNADMSAAVLHDIGHLEVAIRNAYDAALITEQVSSSHWTVDPSPYFPVAMRKAGNGRRYDRNKSKRDQIERARQDAGGSRAPSGKVVAELTFGFWRYMTSAATEHTLWTPFLRSAFPRGTTRRAVDGPIGRMHELRNRVAHHEPLLKTDLEGRRQDLLTLLGLLDDDLCRHVESRSSWLCVAAGRP